MGQINKARYWCAVLYPENMVEDWENKVDDTLQLPYAYCVHDLDTDTQSEHRKDHVHMIIAFPNTTTRNHAQSVFNLLSAPGKKALNKIENVVSIRHMYNYLIHDTDKARKDGKYQYPVEARICGNSFDIGSYEQLGVAEKKAMRKELTDLVRDMRIFNVMDLYAITDDTYGEEYTEILLENIRIFEVMTRSNYLKYHTENETQTH